MNPVKFLLSAALCVMLMMAASPTIVNAAETLPFKIPTSDKSTISPITTDALIGGSIHSFSGFAASFYGWSVNVITILFVVGTLAMIASALFKNGQWQKFGQQSMLWSFISMLALRGLPIIILSIRSTAGIDRLLEETLSMLGFAAVFLCFISIAVSFLFQFGYKLIEHPEFHRWTKNLRSVSVLMVLLAVIIPWLFPII